MLSLALVNAALATVMALWLRALVRSRHEDIPCTTKTFSWAIVTLAVLAIVALVVINVLALQALDRAFGSTLSPLGFTTWLLAMAACAVLFVIALTAAHTNRTAAAWLRLLPPAQLLIRRGAATSTVQLAPGSVRALGVIGGHMYVQYLIEHDDGAIGLVVPFTRDAAAAIEGTPALAHIDGLVAQGAPRELHRHLAPFCQLQ